MNNHSGAPAPHSHEGDWIDTVQGLLVAFVVAMIFRGFVLEGFVIPTGSMAPTLRGQHLRMRGDYTGYAYDADAGPLAESGAAPSAKAPIFDPMVTRQFPVGDAEVGLLRAQSVGGDRVLTLKYLPVLFPPQRWDVPVFKNPPDPIGETQNYIKRLVGMSNESLVLADGDVFTGALDAKPDALRIQRKPEMIQRAVWQPVWRSDWQPADLQRLEQSLHRAWSGPALKPLEKDRGQWSGLSGHDWSWSQSTQTTLQYDAKSWPLTDWNAYNAWRRSPEFPMSDIRMSAAFEAKNTDKFAARMQLITRGVCIEAGVRLGEAFASVTPYGESDKPAHPLAQQKVALDETPAVVHLEVWHVDQTVWLFVNGRRVIQLPYELTIGGTSPRDRLVAAGVDMNLYALDPVANKPKPFESLAWICEGSPFIVRNLRIDRDLYYQPGMLLPGNQVAINGPLVVGRAFACDPANPAKINDDQFLLLGDNSPASRDGRFWGRPHPILKDSIGFDAPFVVPGELLVGKAWCVYFPAPYPLGAGLKMKDPAARSLNIVPNFGSLRFIR